MARHAELGVSRRPKDASVQEMEWRRTCFGTLLYIRVRRQSGKPMSWGELWATFVDAYPGRWAVQVFPPETALVDEANLYHLYVFDEGELPAGMNICRRSFHAGD